MSTGLGQIFPGNFVRRFESVSQSPVPLGSSLSNQSVQQPGAKHSRLDRSVNCCIALEMNTSCCVTAYECGLGSRKAKLVGLEIKIQSDI